MGCPNSSPLRGVKSTGCQDAGLRLPPVKSALVTGGSAGIGLALARMLRDEGHELTLAARRPEPLEEAAQELGAEAVAANLADPDECVRVVARTRSASAGWTCS